MVTSQGNSHGKDKEGAKPCLSKRSRDLCSPFFWDKGDATQAQKCSLWVESQGMTPGHNVVGQNLGILCSLKQNRKVQTLEEIERWL